MGSHPEYKLVGICVWIYEYCGCLGSRRVPTRFNTTGPRAALPPRAARAPTRFINTGLGLPRAPRAPRAARAPKPFINTGLDPPFALGPLGRPGRRNNLLIQGLAPPALGPPRRPGRRNNLLIQGLPPLGAAAPSGGPGAENMH